MLRRIRWTSIEIVVKSYLLHPLIIYYSTFSPTDSFQRPFGTAYTVHNRKIVAAVPVPCGQSRKTSVAFLKSSAEVARINICLVSEIRISHLHIDLPVVFGLAWSVQTLRFIVPPKQELFFRHRPPSHGPIVRPVLTSAVVPPASV